MEHTYQPLSDRVVLRRLDVATQKSAGGIILPPDAAKEKSQIAQVVAVGPGKTLADGSVRPVSVVTGARVLVGKYAGTEIEDQIVIVREDDILAIIG